MVRKLKFYNMLKLFSFGFLLSGTIAFINPASLQAQILVNPPCTNTTCISADMIDIAKNGAAEFDSLIMYWTLILEELDGPPAIVCAEPRPTGVTVHRQIERAIETFPDTICVNQGCAPVNNGEGCE